MKKIIIFVLSVTFAFAAGPDGTTGAAGGEDKLVPVTDSSIPVGLTRSDKNFRGLNVERRASGTIVGTSEPTAEEKAAIEARQAASLAAAQALNQVEMIRTESDS